MVKKIFFISLSLLFFVNLYSQTDQKDSLNNLLNNINYNEQPEESLRLLNSIYEYTYQTDPQTAIEKTVTAIRICDSILKDSTLAMKWYQRLGISYLSIKQYDQAMDYLVKTKDYYKLQGDSVNYAYSLFYMGDIYLGLNVLEIAFQEFEEASKIFKNHNVYKGLIQVNIRLASFYYNDDFDLDKTLEILFSSLQIAGNNDTLKIAVNKAIGGIYVEEYETDSAIYYISKAIEESKKVNNKYELADCYRMLGQLYVEDEQYTEAEKVLRKSLDIFSSLSIESKIAETLNLIGEMYFEKGDLTKAEHNFLKAVNATSYNMFTSENRTIAYQFLTKLYTKQKKYQLANNYYELYTEELKNNFKQQAQQGYTEIILNFQNQENEKTIQLLEKEDALKTQMLKNKQQQVYAFILVIALLIGFAILLYFFFQKQKKINKLLQEQNHQINLQKKEIELQSRILEKATRDLLKQKDVVQSKSNKITASINYASRIQKAMLSSENLFTKNFRDHFILFLPKETVSGDFYWIREIKDTKPSLFKEKNEPQKVIVSVIDCTGHGVPGAFMSLLADAYLNQIVNVQHIYSPEKILAELHKIIRNTLQQEHTDNNDGMDMAICLIDKNKKILEFSGAKNPLIYIQNNQMNRITGGMMSVGGLQRERERYFEKHTIDITSKTTIFLYSDGYQDQFGGKYGRKIMAKPFRNLLFDNYELPADEHKKILLNHLKKWKGKKYHQMDDITIMRIDI